MKYKVIIDTDPGIDDMVALTIALAKSDVFDIKLISTVFGNVNVEQNTKNTLFLLNAMKRKDIKLVKGAKASIANKSINAENVHGKNGLGGFKIKQKINISNIRTDPIEAMKNVIENNKNKIILISLGPKTNIANLFTKYPHVINLIKTHICMGGSLFGRGNITPLSEFNVYADPLAFKIVTEQKKLKTIISPMEIGEQLIFSQEIANEIKKINSIGNFFSQM
jgi:non-specific riboncleoside hydrolase